MKKSLILVIGTVLALSLTACGTAATKELYKAGTYEAVGAGKGGEVPVAVEFSATEIVSVKVGENKETQGIGDLASEQLPAKIIEAQNADIDGVTGATLTSNAILEAVSDCISQAKK